MLVLLLADELTKDEVLEQGVDVEVISEFSDVILGKGG
jgi:hypothetical protein